MHAPDPAGAEASGVIPASFISVRPARSADVDAIHAILSEAAAWLAARGDPMWRPDELDPSAIAAHVQEELYHLAEAEHHPVGTFRFQLSDTLFWPELAADDSAFIHRLAVKRSHAGGGVSAAIFDWARHAAARLGRRYLRLDCDAHRTRLRATYERAGFRLHSYRHVDGFYVARYEIDLNSG